MTGSEESWRFYFDEDAHGRLAAALRRQHVDVETTLAAGRLEASDEEQLDYAAAHGRVLVTRNIAHFPALHAAWLAADRTHYGIVVLAGTPPVGTLFRRMSRLIGRHHISELRNQLVYLGAEYDD